MISLRGVWRHLPLMVQASLIGLLVTAEGEVPWVVLVQTNVRISPSIPWAVVAMVVWLYFYLKYFSGTGWPQTTRAARVESFRSRTLARRVWLWSLGSGGLAALSLIALEMVALRMVHVPVAQAAATAQIPIYSLVPLAVMSAFASGIPEEVGFRGYMQAPLERQYHPVFAVMFVAVLFGLSHLSHGLSISLCFDFAFGLVFGVLAYCANSLLPGIALHCTLDIVLFVVGRHITAAMAARPVIWSAGTDLWFWIFGVVFLLFGGCAVYAFRNLAGMTRVPFAAAGMAG